MNLSICIPTFNRLESLVKLLEILNDLKEDEISYEIIVCDNSTNDKTQTHFEQNKYPNVVYYHNKTNLGLFGNFNSCIARAKGEWIQIMHDDDEITPNYLDGLYPYLQNKDLVTITGRSLIEGLGGRDVAKIVATHNEKLQNIEIKYPSIIEGDELRKRMFRFENPFIFPHVLFRRDLAISIGGFNQTYKFVGDLDFWLKILKYGDCAFVDNLFGSYYLHDSNQMTTIETHWQQSLEHYNIYLEHADFNKSQDQELWRLRFESSYYQHKTYSRITKNHDSYAHYNAIRFNELIALKKIKSTNRVKELLYGTFCFIPPFMVSYIIKSWSLKLKRSFDSERRA